jgi:hypothetical protein
MAMAAMNMVSTGGFSGVSFHLRRRPQGVASVLRKKTPIFGSRRSKLDHLTVYSCHCHNSKSAGVSLPHGNLRVFFYVCVHSTKRMVRLGRLGQPIIVKNG